MKFKTKLALTALTALALVAAACSQAPPVDHYPTFVQAMDRLAGPGQWSAQSHVNGQGDLLTVSGLTIKLPGYALPAARPELPPELEGKDGTVETGHQAPPPTTLDQTLTIATLELKKPLDQKTLGTLLATADWKNQKETRLADSLVLKGITYKAPEGAHKSDYSIEEVTIASPLLSAAGEEAPAGRAGFLKALRLAELTYKNSKIDQSGPASGGLEIQLLMESASAKGLAFDGEMQFAFDRLDPTGLTSAMSAMSAKSLSLKNMVMDINDPKSPFTARLSLAHLDEKDIKAMGAAGDMTLSDLSLTLLDEEKRPTNISLAKLNMRGLDLTDYVNRLTPALIEEILNPGDSQEAFINLYNLGDIFVPFFSLAEASLNDLNINIADGLLIIKLAQAKASGPYVAGQMPLGQKSSLSGLEIILPEDPAKAAQDPAFKDLYDFGRDFGLTRFLIESESDASYDPASGQAVSRLLHFSIKDLLEISGSGEMGGLDAGRLEKLKSVPLAMAGMALLAPDDIFGQTAFHNLNIKLEDKGLTNRLLNLSATKISAEGQVKLEAEAFRQIVLSAMPGEIKRKTKDFLANPETLSQALSTFITEPGTLELKITAQPPVGVKSVMDMGLDLNQILNSMNINISANGQETPTLKFAISN